MKTQKTILIMMVVALMLVSGVTAVTNIKFTNPSYSPFYWLLGGGVMGNFSFTINATPYNQVGVAIKNVSFYTNLSGTWRAHAINTSNYSGNAETERIFPIGDTAINTQNGTSQKTFVWNVYVCDNKSSFTNEPVSLSDGYGNLVNYPVAAISGIMNSTTVTVGAGMCNLTAATGVLKCNQSYYNGSETFTYLTPTILVNYTANNYCKWGTNQTVKYEQTPYITINTPATATWDTDGTVRLNITTYGDSSTYNCDVYNNDTGTWHAVGGTHSQDNNTAYITTKPFVEAISITYAVRCWEPLDSNIYGWSSNNTIGIDLGGPSISITSPADGYYQKRTGAEYVGQWVINVTDPNANKCAFGTNGTAVTFNYTNSISYTSGAATTLNYNATPGYYTWNVTCNDSSGVSTTTANRGLYVDFTAPASSTNTTYVLNGYTNKFGINYTMNEAFNATLVYGTATKTYTFQDVESDFETTQMLELTFNNSYEKPFYYNVTACDRAGNCNGGFGELMKIAPVPLKSGWTLWSVYDRAITLSNYSANSKADYVYLWNQTNQSWLYYSSAATTYGNTVLGRGDVAQVYVATDTTYFRNFTSTGFPQVRKNITAGHVYMGLNNAYTLGEISYINLRNSSGGNVTHSGGTEYQVNYLGSFNNSAQSWVSSIYTWKINNVSQCGNVSNFLDTAWFYTDRSLTLNFSKNGFVYGNLTN